MLNKGTKTMTLTQNQNYQPKPCKQIQSRRTACLRMAGVADRLKFCVWLDFIGNDTRSPGEVGFNVKIGGNGQEKLFLHNVVE